MDAKQNGRRKVENVICLEWNKKSNDVWYIYVSQMTVYSHWCTKNGLYGYSIFIQLLAYSLSFSLYFRNVNKPTFMLEHESVKVSLQIIYITNNLLS